VIAVVLPEHRLQLVCGYQKIIRHSLTLTECGGGLGNLGKVTDVKTSQGFPFPEKTMARPRSTDDADKVRLD